jgi:hypothetical protein
LRQNLDKKQIKMKGRILEVASQMFLNHGFKTVTMDEIAEKMAISKKTIYNHYKNKTALIKETTHFVFERISGRISAICEKNGEVSPIQALFDIDAVIVECLKENDNSAEYQLQKYYPKIFHSLGKKKHELITNGVKNNLEEGIRLGLYRSDINISVITRIYYTNSIAVKNAEVFSPEEFNIPEVMRIYLLYHIRAIATVKGLEELERILQKHKNKSK